MRSVKVGPKLLGSGWAISNDESGRLRRRLRRRVRMAKGVEVCGGGLQA